MALSPAHLDSLERHVRVHEDRLVQLRDELRHSTADIDPNPKGDPNPKPPLPPRPGRREVLDREVRFHEQLVGLARDPKVLNILKDLGTDPELVRWAARDPRAAAQKLGIDIPDGVVLRLTSDNQRVRLRISSYDGLYPFMVTWDSDGGFSPVPESATSAKKGA